VVRALTTGAENPGLEIQLHVARGFFKTPSVHPAFNGYLNLFRAGDGEGGEEEAWHPTSATPLPVQVVL